MYEKYWRIAYDFQEKYKNASTDNDWAEVSAAVDYISKCNNNNEFLAELLSAVVIDISRRDNLSKTTVK